MSDYHGLEVSAKFNTIRIAIHSNTPNGTNLVGYAYDQALLEYFGETPTTAVPWLEATNPTEFGQIQTGNVFETVEVVGFDANATQSEKVQAMNEYVAARKPQVEADMLRRLEYWGADRMLPT